jgi:hypothetical protein
MRKALAIISGMLLFLTAATAPVSAFGLLAAPTPVQQQGQLKDCIDTDSGPGISCQKNRTCAVGNGTCYLWTSGEDPLTENPNGDACGCV